MFRAESPFPFTLKTGAVVTDERCQCGALRSQHENTIAYGHGPRLGEPERITMAMGNGVIYDATERPTLCARFTWAARVFTSMGLADCAPGFSALDDKHVIKVERANKRNIGAKGYRYEIRDLSKPAGREQRIITCQAPSARTRAQGLEHARTELQIYLERRAGMVVLKGGAL